MSTFFEVITYYFNYDFSNESQQIHRIKQNSI